MGGSIWPATGATGQDAGAVYPLGSSLGESARLQRQAEELAADSAALLDRVGLRPGQSAIDLGCGPRGILDLLAERVSPGGRVVGLDANPAHTAMAAEFAARRGLSGVEIITADARSTGLPPGSFDLVHARTLLVNLSSPPKQPPRWTRLARPGGWVASMEPDTEHALCYPPHPAFDRLRDIFTVAFSRNGADPWNRPPGTGAFPPGGTGTGRGGGQGADVPARQLPADRPPGPGARHAPAGAGDGPGHGRRTDELDAAARAHLDDPHTVVMSGLLFLTWGRKPDHAPGDSLPSS